MRKIILTTTKEAEVSAEELLALRREAFRQWMEAGLTTSASHQVSAEQFAHYLSDKTVFIARDAATGELLAMHTLRLDRRKGTAWGANLAVAPSAKHEGIGTRMLQEEVAWLRKAGVRYMIGGTGIPAVWSVRWHRKNGYYVCGYYRSEGENYGSYKFRKPISLDVRRHPGDVFWLPGIASVTAKVQYVMYYLATCVCKTREGKLNQLGKWVKRLKR
ncbi:MAG: GNAT family N-acetyltransferase [Prevotella sp.]|nr:GNAT family N-acetyltransferase [Prevotella sp.]